MTSVELDHVAVTQRRVAILRGIDLRAESGTVLGLIGPSGSGKTSALRVIAGIDRQSSGTVRFDGVDVTDRAPRERNVAMVFQSPALVPSRSVARNIAFPLELRRATAEEIRRRVGAEARALHIEALLERSPSRLSAGEAQVVQIARALVRFPDVLLLDEPFAHLDAHRAEAIRTELTMIQRAVGVTTVIATNDRLDAMVLCDRLAVVEAGRITQIGTPLEVFDAPRTAAAALMTGDAEVLEVRIVTDGLGAWIQHDGFRLRSWRPALIAHDGRRLQMVVRPHWWRLDERGPVSATVERMQRLGPVTTLWCRVGGGRITIATHGSLGEHLTTGGHVMLGLERFVLLDPRDGHAIDH